MIASRLWTTTLKEISDEIIDKALEKCIDVNKWPPEISEFKQLCLSFKESSLIPWSSEVLEMKNYKGFITNPSVERLIDEGAKVCKLLKSIYPALSWIKISSKFSELKKKTKIYYKDLSSIDHVIQLSKYTLDDIYQVFNLEAK